MQLHAGRYLGRLGIPFDLVEDVRPVMRRNRLNAGAGNADGSWAVVRAKITSGPP